MRQCYRRSPHRQGVLGSTLFVGVIALGGSFDNRGTRACYRYDTFCADGSHLLVAAAVGNGTLGSSRGGTVVGKALGEEYLFVAVNFVEGYRYGLFAAVEFVEGEVFLAAGVAGKTGRIGIVLEQTVRYGTVCASEEAIGKRECPIAVLFGVCFVDVCVVAATSVTYENIVAIADRHATVGLCGDVPDNRLVVGYDFTVGKVNVGIHEVALLVGGVHGFYRGSIVTILVYDDVLAIGYGTAGHFGKGLDHSRVNNSQGIFYERGFVGSRFGYFGLDGSRTAGHQCNETVLSNRGHFLVAAAIHDGSVGSRGGCTAVTALGELFGYIARDAGKGQVGIRFARFFQLVESHIFLITRRSVAGKPL